MITVRQLSVMEVGRIAEIDRSEHVTLKYRFVNGSMESFPVNLRIPRWPPDGDDSHSVPARMKKYRDLIRQGGVMLGAFDDKWLVGFAVVRYRLRDEMAELAAIFVSRAYRRRGTAKHLYAEAERFARANGAKSIYASSTPTESAFGFYRSQGFAPVLEPLADMLALEPDDIHMMKQLN